VEGGLDRGKLLQAFGEEEELVRPVRLGEVLLRPDRDALERAEELPLLHVEEVEADRAVGDFSLALVVVQPFDDLLLG